MTAKRTSKPAVPANEIQSVELPAWTDLEYSETAIEDEWPIDCSEGLPYREQWDFIVPVFKGQGPDCEFVTWSAKNDNGQKPGYGGSILLFIPDTGEAPVVQIRANTPAVRQRLKRLAAKRSAAQKHFGDLFIEGNPSETFQDICSACCGNRVIPERLSKKIAEATANLDFLWLQGYAEAVKFIRDEVEKLNTEDAQKAWDEKKKKLFDLLSRLSPCNGKDSLVDLAIPEALLIRDAIKEAGGRSKKITIEHLEMAHKKQMQGVAVLMLANAVMFESWRDEQPPTPKRNVDNEEVGKIIKSVTKRLAEGGNFRPPSKSEVLEEVNALLKERNNQRGISWEGWELRRLNDALESLGFLWLAHPREVKRKG